MIEVRQTETFRAWVAGLRDRRAAAIIAARLVRLAAGNLGDVRPIGEGLSELRVHHGPGYRVYLKAFGSTLVVLLAGSDKAGQARAIKAAKRAAREL